MSSNRISSNDDETADVYGPSEHVVAFTTEDEQLVVYDELEPTAWIQSTHAVRIAETR